MGKKAFIVLMSLCTLTIGGGACAVSYYATQITLPLFSLKIEKIEVGQKLPVIPLEKVTTEQFERELSETLIETSEVVIIENEKDEEVSDDYFK